MDSLGLALCMHVCWERDTDKSGLTSPASTGRQQSWLPSIAAMAVAAEAPGAWGAASSSLWLARPHT